MSAKTDLEAELFINLEERMERHLGKDSLVFTSYEKYRETHAYLPEMLNDAFFKRNPEKEEQRTFQTWKTDQFG
jgi:hypothetical protein